MDKKKQSGLGIASLILGIVGLVSCCIIIGIIPCIIGLILGIIALKDKRYSHGTAIAGVVCCGLGVFLFVIVLFVGIMSPTNTNTDTEQNTQIEKNSQIYIETELEVIESEIAENQTQEIEQETQKELTEEEYKELCEELYNDDFFKSTPEVGLYVKVHVMASEVYKYSSSDIFGMVVKDITKEYNLEKNSLGCTVMHESTKDDSVPSYFGKQIYIMFVNGSDLTLDYFEGGEKYIIYGEVIQNVNGTFILPKYIEMEE